MPNDPRNDRFIPEAIDEQIAQLKQGNQPDAVSARLVKDLERTYREEQEEEQAIERIHTRLMAKMQPTGEQQMRQLSDELPRRKRIGRTNTHIGRANKQQWQQKWNVLAAAVVVAMVVGSLITVLQLTHRNQSEGRIHMGSTEQPTAATKKALPTDPGLYLGLLNQLVKVDRQTNKVLWRFIVKSDPKDRPAFQQPQIHNTPIVADGMVYFTAQTGRVYAVDTQTGKLRWERNFQMDLWPLKMANGILYVSPGLNVHGSPGNSIYALDPADGTTKITYKMGGQITGIFDGIMYVNNGATLTAVKVSDGSQVWAAIIDAKGQQHYNGNVYLKNGKLYASSIGARDSYMYMIDPQNGKITWTSPMMNGFVLDIAIGDDGRIYCGAQTSYVYAFDPRLKSLKELWKYRATIEHLYATPIVQNGTVYVGQISANQHNSNDDNLIALNATTGQQKWLTPLTGYTGGNNQPPVFHNGVIYLGTAGGLQGFAADSGKQVMMIPSDLLVSKKDVGNSGLFQGIAITIVD
jgi:outer membrane protein assembly factor BamB